MADWFSAASDLVGGVSDYFAGQAQAKGANQAADYYKQAAAITERATQLKEIQAQRGIYQTQSAAQAAAGANNLEMGGSAADIIRSNAQQGALTRSTIAEQGRIQEQAYLGQAASAAAEAKASKSSGKGGLVGGALSAVSTVAQFIPW